MAQVAWDEFEPVATQESATDWDEFEPADYSPEREEKRKRLLTEQAALTKEQASQERTQRIIDPILSGVEGALTGLSLSPSAIARNLEAGIPATAAVLRGEERFTPLKPVVSEFMAGDPNKLPRVPGGEEWYTQVPAGVANTIISLVDMTLTPEGIATLGIAGMPRAQQQAVLGLVAANMASHYPEEFNQAVEAADKGDLATATEKFLTSPLMASVAGRAAIDMPPAVKPVPEFPGVVDPDLAARNLASPGTFGRANEQAMFGPSIPMAPNEMFAAGEIPFNRMQRFGGTPLAPIEILEVAAPEETRPIEQRETRGKVSFGAEAPTLLRTAIEEKPAAEPAPKKTFGFDEPQNPMVTVYQGQEGGSGGGSYWTTNPARARSYGGNVMAVEIPRDVFEKAEAERAKTGSGTSGDVILSNEWANKAKQVEVPEQIIDLTEAAAPDVAADFVNQVKNTEQAFEFGWQNQSPEGIAALEKVKADITAKMEAVKADPNLPPMEKLNQRASLATQSQLINEAISVAKKETDRTIVKEFLDKKSPPAPPVEPTAPAKPAKPLGPKAAAAEFDRLVREFGPELGWVSNIELLGDQGLEGRTGHGTISIKAKVERNKVMQAARNKALSQLADISKVDVRDPKVRAELLPKLQELLAPKIKANEFLKNASEGPNNFDLGDSAPGDTFKVKGRDFEVVEHNPEAGTVRIKGSGDYGEVTVSNENVLRTDEAPVSKIIELPKGDDVIGWLESKKFDAPGGAVFSLPHPEVFARVGKQIWNDAIDLAIAAVKGGRAIKEAINEALQYMRKQASGFDEAKVRANLEYVIKNETKPAPAPAKRPAGSAPAPTPKPAGGSAPAPSPAPAPGSAPTPTPGGGPAPAPAPRPVPAPRPAPAPGAATLNDIYSIFEVPPKKGPGIRARVSQAAEAFRTGFSSSFRPLNKLAEDIAKAYGGTKRDLAGIFEQLKGASGKAEADVYRFDRDVSKLVKGKERDFSAYVFLRRSLDRLRQDAADIARELASPGSVKKLNRRAVSDYTIPELEAKLATLESKLSPDDLTKFEKAADEYQRYMDAALKWQVDSGRMSLKKYNEIKEGNQFYAPFKVMEHLENTLRPPGTGRRIDTKAKFTQAMEGIRNPDFKLGEMLAAARQNITLSRILAEKNIAMRNITDLSALDVNETFVKRLNAVERVPSGKEAVTVMEGGKPVRYAVDPTVARAVESSGANSGYLLARMAGGLFRAGATTFNLPFQAVNIIVDTVRASLVSKYGVRAVSDLIRYPFDMIHGIYTAASGELFNKKNQLFLDFLDSGVSGATFQSYLTPESLKFKPSTGRMSAVDAGKSTLDSVSRIANAIEQVNKIVGVKRAMRFEGVRSGAELAKRIPEAITEVRRFSGSPDFGRMGKWTDQYRLNLLYMFLNARIQGTIADVGRVTGRDGAKLAAQTWGRIGTVVGLPTLFLYLLNNSDEYREDYEKRPDQEKRNYWLIPKDKYIKAADGEMIRDYWRIPKRELMKWTANILEEGLNFAWEKDPESLKEFGAAMIEELSPVNISGKTAQERLESVGSSLNPLVKAPLELATGRDLYRHRNIVPDVMKKASPEQQFTDRTAEVFKRLAESMPDIAPDVLRSPLMIENLTKNLTAGLFTQFVPRKPIEGRTAFENNPLMQRFQSLPYTDSSEFDERMSTMERESADAQLDRHRKASKLIENNKDMKLPGLVKAAISQHGADERLVERVVDLWTAKERGITPEERRVMALPVEQRAKFITQELAGKSPEEKAALIKEYAIKRILTERVAAEMAPETLR